jgi:lipopolysaccharide cholinephosphotransferase
MVNLNIQLPNDFLNEEIRCGYTVSSKMKEVWAVELDLLVELMRVCKLNGIQIYADGGTALGCVRHGGFIPWDDDIDIAVSREDYDKLTKLTDSFKYPYFLQTEATSPGIFRKHIQLRNSETTGALQHEVKFKFNQGIFIDVFPLDNIPDDEKEAYKFIQSYIRKKDITRTYLYCQRECESQFSVTMLREPKKISKRLLGYMVKAFGLYKMSYMQLEKLMKKYKGYNTKKVCNLSMTIKDNYKRTSHEASFLHEPPIMMKFEFIELPVPCNYDSILHEIYGNYMVYKKNASCHSNVLFDTNISYKDFLKRKVGD